MDDFKNYRDESRANYGTRKEKLTIDQINAGSLQRIADSTERMAVNYTTLQKERDRYQQWYYEEIARAKSLQRTIAALRGVITKLKKQNQ